MKDSIFVYKNQAIVPDINIIILGCLDSARAFAMRLLNHDIQFDYFLCPVAGNYMFPQILNKSVIDFDACRKMERAIIVAPWSELENARRILSREGLEEYLVEVESLNPIIRATSTLVVWGTGSRAEHFYSNYKDCLDIKYFCDSNKEKAGTYFYGKEIIHFSVLGNLPKDTVVIVASTAYCEISEKALQCGIDKNNIFCIKYKLNDFVIKLGEEEYFSYPESALSSMILDFRNENLILYGNTKIVKKFIQRMDKLGVAFAKAVGRDALNEDGTIFNLSYTLEGNEVIALLDNQSWELETMLEQIGTSYFWIKTYSSFQILPDQSITKLLDPNLGNSYSRGSDDYPGFIKFEYIQEACSEPIRIVTLGGSTTSAFSVRNKTWSEYLSNELQKKGVSHIIYCGGMQSYRVSQEVVKLIRDALLLKPDFIISYSGVNELDLRNSQSLRHPFLNYYQLEMFEEIGRSLRDSDRKLTWGIQNNMDVFEYWFMMERIMNSICETLKIRMKAFLQPILYTKAKCYQTDADVAAKYGFFYDLDRMEFVRIDDDKNAHLELEFAKSFRENGQIIHESWFCDLSSIFDDKEYVYMDTCHVYEKGNRLIAAKIFEEIYDELYAIQREKGMVD